MGVPAPIGISASGRTPYYPDDQANGVIQGQITAVGPGRPFALWGPANLTIWGSLATALTTTAGSLSYSVASPGTLAPGAAVNSVNVPRGTTIATIAGSAGLLALPTYTLWGKTKAGIAQITGLGLTTGLLGAAVSGPGVPAGTVVTGILTPALPPGVAPSAFDGQNGVVQLNNAITTADTINKAHPFEFALSAQAITTTGADAAATFTAAAIVYSGSVQLERSFDGGLTWVVCNIGVGTLAIFNGGAPISITFGEPERQVLYRLNTTAFSAGPINYRISETGQASTSLSVPALS